MEEEEMYQHQVNTSTEPFAYSVRELIAQIGARAATEFLSGRRPHIPAPQPKNTEKQDGLDWAWAEVIAWDA